MVPRHAARPDERLAAGDFSTAAAEDTRDSGDRRRGARPGGSRTAPRVGSVRDRGRPLVPDRGFFSYRIVDFTAFRTASELAAHREQSGRGPV
ncbi:hypothetical protein GCM10018793_42670 [Streptomyces sulfonofaciens]|uniref:Uncharacterized protein n=1 Tax=Streptomyces sulfonofaciens TaxID=68272 RepID=A0A919GDL2_9ACTN|nr:hypothetical protein GCM10018793_42670 [Streptomyces sulfonofaciens]